MGELKMEDMPLPSLFEQSRRIHLAATESAVDQDTVGRGIEALRKCEDMISKLGLFSANETKDDISTSNLKYILVPFYLAELTEKVATDDRELLRWGHADYKEGTFATFTTFFFFWSFLLEQWNTMKMNCGCHVLQEFVSFCEAMELFPKEELETSVQGVSNQMVDQRARKIARFKRQKAAESKLLEIKERKERRGRSTKAAALSTPVEAGEEEMVDDDSEEEREAWLTTISLAICKTLDLLEMLKKEEEMLSAIKEKQSKEGEKEFSRAILNERMNTAEAWHRNAAARARYTKPAQPITCATFAQDVLEGRANVSDAHEHKHQPLIFGPASLINGSLTSERDRMAAQVFQPSYRMPTMSIEEAGLKEMQMMQKFQERNAKLMEEANSAWFKERKQPGPVEDEDEDNDDAAQEKARAWDDWKDDNPRGAGNKKLTPCG